MIQQTWAGPVNAWRILPGVVLSLALLPGTVTETSAANCIDQVRKIAVDYNLTIDPPNASTVITPGELAESGGVIEPPRVGDHAVVDPNMPNSGMPTVPDIARTDQTGSGRQTLSGQDRLVLQGILNSARSEARRGDTAGCFDRLGKAQQFLRKRSG